MTRCGLRAVPLDLAFRMKKISSRLVWIALALCLAGAAHAADGPSRGSEYDFLFPRSTSGQSLNGAALPPEIAPPLERPIDPQSYRMIPGDLLELAVGGEADRTWRLSVSAEGMLLVPGSSAIDATGKSLAELVETVRSGLAPRFPGKPISLHLLQPGAFRVPVTGQVQTPESTRCTPMTASPRRSRLPAVRTMERASGRSS